MKDNKNKQSIVQEGVSNEGLLIGRNGIVRRIEEPVEAIDNFGEMAGNLFHKEQA